MSIISFVPRNRPRLITDFICSHLHVIEAGQTQRGGEEGEEALLHRFTAL